MITNESTQQDFGKLSFEEGMTELERLVERLESSQVGLEESLALYERGHALQQYLAQVLKNTELRIEKISQSSVTVKQDADDATSVKDSVKGSTMVGDPQSDTLPF